MASSLISYAGWTFLPGLVSGWIQTIYYGITIRAGDPKPAPGSPRFIKHRRNIQITVIVIYLLYTIYEADYILRQDGDFYSIMGVPLDADDKKIKSRFRRLAAIYHPDKLQLDTPQSYANAEQHFVRLKTAQDTLTDPIKRFAYNRFGPEALTWSHCVTARDYISRGVTSVQGPLYAGSIGAMIGISFFSTFLSTGKFWRYLVLALVMALEGHTITRPYSSPILEKVINPLLVGLTAGVHPPLLPFQLLVLARKATFTLFIAFSQLSGLFEDPNKTKAGKKGNGDELDLAQLARLEGIAKGNDQEAQRLLAMDLAPFVGDEVGSKELNGRVRDWLVNNTIRSDPEVRDAMGKVMQKRRVGAPHGARN